MIKKLLVKGHLILCLSAIVMPTGGFVSSQFGWRSHPITKKTAFHSGVDIVSGYAASIKAVAEGSVSFAGKKRGYGNLVILRHQDGIETFYGHMGRTFVKEGECVSQGQVIGWMGLTGLSTGTHLHYEIRKNGIPVDPARFSFKQKPLPIAKEHNLLWAILNNNVDDFFKLPNNIF